MPTEQKASDAERTWTPRWIYRGMKLGLVPYCTLYGGPADKVRQPLDNEILMPVADHLSALQKEKAEREAEAKRLKANALESQGAIQPVIGALRMGNLMGDVLDRLERCYDFIKRNVDGEDWEAQWAVLTDEPNREES